MNNQDTDRTAAIRKAVKHLDPVFVRWFDDLLGHKIAENGGFFDVFAKFWGKNKPIETKVTIGYRDYTSE